MDILQPPVGDQRPGGFDQIERALFFHELAAKQHAEYIVADSPLTTELQSLRAKGERLARESDTSRRSPASLPPPFEQNGGDSRRACRYPMKMSYQIADPGWVVCQNPSDTKPRMVLARLWPMPAKLEPGTGSDAW